MIFSPSYRHPNFYYVANIHCHLCLHHLNHQQPSCNYSPFPHQEMYPPSRLGIVDPGMRKYWVTVCQVLSIICRGQYLSSLVPCIRYKYKQLKENRGGGGVTIGIGTSIQVQDQVAIYYHLSKVHHFSSLIINYWFTYL